MRRLIAQVCADDTWQGWWQTTGLDVLIVAPRAHLGGFHIQPFRSEGPPGPASGLHIVGSTPELFELGRRAHRFNRSEKKFNRFMSTPEAASIQIDTVNQMLNEAARHLDLPRPPRTL